VAATLRSAFFFGLEKGESPLGSLTRRCAAGTSRSGWTRHLLCLGRGAIGVPAVTAGRRPYRKDSRGSNAMVKDAGAFLISLERSSGAFTTGIVPSQAARGAFVNNLE
jgi:hypothetical protein